MSKSILPTERITKAILHGSFATAPRLELPEWSIVEDEVLGSTSVIIEDALASLIDVLPKDDLPGRVDTEILRTRCVNLVSFSENLANFAAANRQLDTFHFDYNEYKHRICKSFWIFAFALCANSSEMRKSLVIEVFTCCAVQRGLHKDLYRGFLALPVEMCQKVDQLVSCLTYVSQGIYAASMTRKAFARKSSRPPTTLSASWTNWMLTLMVFAEKGPFHRQCTDHFFFNCISTGSETNVGEHETAASDLTTTREMTAQVKKFLLSDAVCSLPISRAHLRYIYTNIFGALNEKHAKNDQEQMCPLLKPVLQHVFHTWEKKDVAESEDSNHNESLFNSVMYALLFLKDAKVQSLPASLLAPFLNGVTVRMESVDGSRQTHGMTAAAAFATFFVENSDVAANFLQNKEFFSHLDEWLKTEEGKRIEALSSVSGHADEASPQQISRFVRTEIFFPEGKSFAIDPDEPHAFFSEMKSEQSLSVAVAVPAAELTDPFALPSFGIQKLEKDDSDTAILSTIRESFDAILGVGRGANAQMHEIQQNIESGLRGLSKALSKAKKNLTTDGKISFPASLDPLIPSLLPSLMSLTIYAPEEKTQALYALRSNVIVDLIVLSTKISLNVLSGMVFGSNYGVYQRVEMVRSAGVAAKELASIEITASHESNASRDVPRDRQQKRIYPPIPTAAPRQFAISDEGKLTRRWGNAVESRIRAKGEIRKYANMLGGVATVFLSCFLAKIDADHFKFFQQTEPYVPAEIMRTLVIVFQGITQLRHITPKLCEQNIEFFLSVGVGHPHLAVRKQGWVAVGEVMRCWCGAPPLLNAESKSYSARTTQFSHRGSLMFNEQWMCTLEGLQVACASMEKEKDAAFATAALATAGLRDLVCEQNDLVSMVANDSGIVAI